MSHKLNLNDEERKERLRKQRKKAFHKWIAKPGNRKRHYQRRDRWYREHPEKQEEYNDRYRNDSEYRKQRIIYGRKYYEEHKAELNAKRKREYDLLKEIKRNIKEGKMKYIEEVYYVPIKDPEINKEK